MAGIILALKVCSLLNGECEPLDIRTDVRSIQACYLGAAGIIASVYPELMDEAGMGERKLKMKEFQCRNQ